MTSQPPSPRQYLAEHNPDALLAYNQALQLLKQLISTDLCNPQIDPKHKNIEFVNSANKDDHDQRNPSY